MERGDEKEKRKNVGKKKEVAVCSGQWKKEIRRRWWWWRGGGADRGDWGETAGRVKSGDLQVQLEQPVTLMAH